MIVNLKWAMNNVYQSYTSLAISLISSNDPFKFLFSLNLQLTTTPTPFPLVTLCLGFLFYRQNRPLPDKTFMFPKPNIQSHSIHFDPDLLHSYYKREAIPTLELGAQTLELEMLWSFLSYTGISESVIPSSRLVNLFSSESSL